MAHPAKNEAEPLSGSLEHVMTKIMAGKIISAKSVVSLFSGCGGLDLGFMGGFKFLDKTYDRLPFKIIWANDIEAAACETYRHNIGGDIVCGDIWKAMDSLPKKADVVIGGFPCQDVSINGLGQGGRGQRTNLYKAMIDVVERISPRVFVAENVKGLLLARHRALFERVIKDFEALGYHVQYQVYLAADYGIPQMRERVFIIGTHGKERFMPPVPTHRQMNWITARAAIKDLEAEKENVELSHIWSKAKRNTEQGSRNLKADKPSATIRAECHGNIHFHYSLPRRLSMREAARCQSFPDNFLWRCGIRQTERQIGNAVPPVLAWHIANAVRNLFV